MTKPTYVVAEMACSHEGDPALARQIIDGAGRAGADAVQFQMWALDRMVVPHHPDYALLQQLELSRTVWTDLAAHVRRSNAGLAIVACVYEPSSVDLAEALRVEAYKIHSSDVSNPQLLREVAQTGKVVHLSVGSSTTDEIREAIDALVGGGSGRVVLMYGFQSFPTAPRDVHLSYVTTLRRLFDRPVGYQDHSDADQPEAFWIPAAAAGLGVEVLEKHITHDRSKKGIDHESALNPDEFVAFVRMVRSVDLARGSALPRSFSDAEQRYRRYAKKSLVAARRLEAGETMQASDLVPMRADGLGLPPASADRLVGRTLRRAIDAYHIVSEEDVQ
ncbi:MAG: N-acetylneuraminate synthase family protein [Acidobacteriota bacterium]